jgi:hypothetical protein
MFRAEKIREPGITGPEGAVRDNDCVCREVHKQTVEGKKIRNKLVDVVDLGQLNPRLR